MSNEIEDAGYIAWRECLAEDAVVAGMPLNKIKGLEGVRGVVFTFNSPDDARAFWESDVSVTRFVATKFGNDENA